MPNTTDTNRNIGDFYSRLQDEMRAKDAKPLSNEERRKLMLAMDIGCTALAALLDIRDAMQEANRLKRFELGLLASGDV